MGWFCSAECARQRSRLYALSSMLCRRDDLGWWLRPLSVADCTAAGGRLTARPYITTCTDSPRARGGGVKRLRERESEASKRLLGRGGAGPVIIILKFISRVCWYKHVYASNCFKVSSKQVLLEGGFSFFHLSWKAAALIYAAVIVLTGAVKWMNHRLLHGAQRPHRS